MRPTRRVASVYHSSGRFEKSRIKCAGGAGYWGQTRRGNIICTVAGMYRYSSLAPGRGQDRTTFYRESSFTYRNTFNKPLTSVAIARAHMQHPPPQGYYITFSTQVADLVYRIPEIYMPARPLHRPTASQTLRGDSPGYGEPSLTQ